ncbi:MAG: leucyl/phenylalanyl-tRNA--protein transferase [Planctomycetota bacterium]
MRSNSELTSQEQALVHLLLSAYADGAFPMGEPESDEIHFYTTDTRGIIPLDDPAVRPSSRLARTIRSGRFEFTTDQAFDRVIGQCALPRRTEDETWITPTIREWYNLLHSAGHAHSLEAWRTDPDSQERALVGGIYGVSLGSAFFGESMFHSPQPRLPDASRHPHDGTDASKACFYILAEHLRNRGFTLFDAQFPNDHISTLGCVAIDAESYKHKLDCALEAVAQWLPFEPDALIASVTQR